VHHNTESAETNDTLSQVQAEEQPVTQYQRRDERSHVEILGNLVNNVQSENPADG
jgi:ribonucleotide reductase beta subunit family protein with ferritin-like domain